MISFALIEIESRLIQEDEHGALCIFTSRDRAEYFRMNISNRPSQELEVVECEVIKPRQAIESETIES